MLICVQMPPTCYMPSMSVLCFLPQSSLDYAMTGSVRVQMGIELDVHSTAVEVAAGPSTTCSMAARLAASQAGAAVRRPSIAPRCQGVGLHLHRRDDQGTELARQLIRQQLAFLLWRQCCQSCLLCCSRRLGVCLGLGCCCLGFCRAELGQSSRQRPDLQARLPKSQIEAARGLEACTESCPCLHTGS